MTNDESRWLDRPVLTRWSLRGRGLRFGSPTLAALGRRLGPRAQVRIRIDPTEPTCVHVLNEERGTSNRADLLSPAASDAC